MLKRCLSEDGDSIAQLGQNNQEVNILEAVPSTS